MCIPPYIRYILDILIFIIVGILQLSSIIDISIFEVAIIVIFFTIVLKPKCPRCKLHVGAEKNGLVSFIVSKNCKKCGQNLMKCKIENKKRKKEEK